MSQPFQFVGWILCSHILEHESIGQWIPEEAIITSASSDEEGSIVIFQQISQEGSEVRIRACGGHGFPVYSLPGLEFSEKYRETMDFLEKNLVFKMVLKKDKVLRGDTSPSS